MKLQEAKADARAAAIKSKMPIALVNEGLHADEFAERDEDGNSYGYCPELAVPILYRYGTVVEIITK
jgi:hypothetical protein